MKLDIDQRKIGVEINIDFKVELLDLRIELSSTGLKSRA